MRTLQQLVYENINISETKVCSNLLIHQIWYKD